MEMKVIMNMRRLVIFQLLCMSLMFSSSLIHADVDHKTGSYTHSVSDILVQSVGGKVVVSRTWKNGQWLFDWSRAPLQIHYGFSSDYGPGIEVSRIEHVGENFKHSSETTTDITLPSGGVGYHKKIVYKAEGLENQWFVREGDIAGNTQDIDAEKMLPIRWESLAGDWAIFLIPTIDEAFAQVDRIGNRDGLISSYVYDTQNRLTNINDRNGNPVITYTYNGEGQLREVSDNSGRRVEYRYTNQQLSEVVDVRGNTTQYAYTNDKLTRITDQESRVKEIAYGNTGRVQSETLIEIDGSRSTTSYRYDYDTTRKETYAQIRGPSGRVTEKWYDEDSNIVRKAVNNIQVYSQSVDKANKRYLTRDQRNLQTIKQYDEWYNQIQRTNPDGSTITSSYVPGTNQVTERTDELGRITRYSYDSNGKMTQRIDAAGSDEERITQYRYDSNGKLIEKKRLGDASTQESVTTYGYDDKGNLNRVTDPEGGITRFTHNIWGGVLTRTDPNNHTWQYTYDAAGNRLSQTDPLQQSVTMTYDGVGNRKSITDARTYTTRYNYNARNQKVSITDPLDHNVQLNYDIAGQLLGTTDPLGNGNRITYDLSKRIINQQDTAGNQTTFGYGERTGEGGGLSGSVNYPGQLNRIQYPTYLQTYDYDNRNRRTRTIDHLESGPVITSNTYDEVGNKLSSTDAEGRVTQYQYDSLNRLIRITDPLNQSTIFRYDNRDNLLSVTDPNNHTTRYTYDRADRKTSEIRPGGQTITYTYDLAGNLMTTTDPDGRRTVNNYDNANQLASQTHYAPGSTDAERTVTYSYDANGNLTGWSDGSLSATMAYDANNQKTQETVNYGAYSLTHRYTYDAAGNKETYTGPDGVTITYHRVNDRLSRIEIPNEGSIVYNSYQWNRPTRITYPGGAYRQTEYDNLQRPTRIQSNDPGDNPLMDFQYGYDATGNILEKSTQDKTYAYHYDTLQRLTEATATIELENDETQTETEGWDYDPNGNRTLDVLKPGNWLYDVNDRLLSSPEVTYGYDAAGHMTSKTVGGITTTYLYNAEGRLTRIEDADQNLIASYVYDPLGRRLKKTTQQETIIFHYTDEGLAGEFEQSGNLLRVYGYQPDSTWTTDPVYQKSSAGYAYYQNDHLGTPQQLVQKSGAKVWEGEYRAFGELVGEEGSWGNLLRFPGQYYDEETGNYYNYFRDYDPATGRYLQSDPIGLDGGLNTYLYANANPLSHFDKYGLSPGECKVLCIGVPIHWAVTCTRYEWKCDGWEVTNIGLYVWPGDEGRGFNIWRMMSCEEFDSLSNKGHPGARPPTYPFDPPPLS
jgi:RHS repeat-associated protein